MKSNEKKIIMVYFSICLSWTISNLLWNCSHFPLFLGELVFLLGLVLEMLVLILMELENISYIYEIAVIGINAYFGVWLRGESLSLILVIIPLEMFTRGLEKNRNRTVIGLSLAAATLPGALLGINSNILNLIVSANILFFVCEYLTSKPQIKHNVGIQVQPPCSETLNPIINDYYIDKLFGTVLPAFAAFFFQYLRNLRIGSSSDFAYIIKSGSLPNISNFQIYEQIVEGENLELEFINFINNINIYAFLIKYIILYIEKG